MKLTTKSGIILTAIMLLFGSALMAQRLPRVFKVTNVDNAVENKMVDFTYSDNGKNIKLSELTKGKVVFLNFWGTWCGPCKREIPDIIQLTKDLKDKDFIVIGVALEGKVETESEIESAYKKVVSFAGKSNIDYHLFIGTLDLVKAYGGISAVPTTYIIDKNGNIVESIVGARDKEGFLSSIKKAL